MRAIKQHNIQFFYLFSKMSTILVFLLWSANFQAQVHIDIDTTSIRIGEQIQCELSISKEATSFPKLVLDSLNKMEILYKSPIDSSQVTSLKRKYILTSFDAGLYKIPAQRIQINNKEYLSDSLLIEVQTVAVDTTKQKLFPIKHIYKAKPKTWHEYLYLLWWILGVLLVVGGIILLIIKLRQKRVLRNTPSLTPIEAALQHFHSLDEKDLVTQKKIKAYYIELTEIVRQYIGDDVQIPTLEVTTDELIQLLEIHNKSQKIGIPKERITALHHFLKNADLVKFAKLEPDYNQITQDRDFAETIVQDFQTELHKPVLDEYGNEIHIETAEERELKATKKRRRFITFTALGVVFVGLMLTTWYYGLTYVKDSLFGHPTKELLEGEWYASYYGYPSIGLETPGILKSEKETPIQSARANQLFLTTNIFTLGSFSEGFYIKVKSDDVVEKNEELLDYIVQQELDELATQAISKLDYEVEDVETNAIKGKRIVATFTMGGLPMEYDQHIYINGKSIQQIAIMHKKDDVYAKEIKARVLKSIQLEVLDTDEEDDY